MRSFLFDSSCAILIALINETEGYVQIIGSTLPDFIKHLKEQVKAGDVVVIKKRNVNGSWDTTEDGEIPRSIRTTPRTFRIGQKQIDIAQLYAKIERGEEMLYKKTAWT